MGLGDKVGSLTKGKQADLILLNTRSLSLVGWDRSNPSGVIIQQAQTADVDTVMVAGKLALLPMMAVAGYALWLRLEQYGLTPERIGRYWSGWCSV